jgi:hypothetical protein
MLHSVSFEFSLHASLRGFAHIRRASALDPFRVTRYTRQAGASMPVIEASGPFSGVDAINCSTKRYAL